MKQVFFLAAAMLWITASNAQVHGYESGVSVNAYSGVTYMNLKSLRTYMNNPEVLEHVAIPYTLYTQVGGEWMAVADRWTIGSGVNILNSPEINIDSIEFDIDGWGGFIKIGYHYLQTSTAFAYAHLALGAGGSSLTVTNLGTAVNRSTGFMLSPAKSLTFADGLYFIDGGTGYKIIFSSLENKNISGVTLGIDGGCKLYISSRNTHREPPLHNEEGSAARQVVDEPIGRTVFVPYVQMTVGFSSFRPQENFRK